MGSQLEPHPNYQKNVCQICSIKCFWRHSPTLSWMRNHACSKSEWHDTRSKSLATLWAIPAKGFGFRECSPRGSFTSITGKLAFGKPPSASELGSWLVVVRELTVFCHRELKVMSKTRHRGKGSTKFCPWRDSNLRPCDYESERPYHWEFGSLSAGLGITFHWNIPSHLRLWGW